MKNKNRSIAMKRLWKKRHNGHYIGQISEQKRYTIKTTIVGNSKKELLAKVRALANQIRREVK
jgi:hypothetical protein